MVFVDKFLKKGKVFLEKLTRNFLPIEQETQVKNRVISILIMIGCALIGIRIASWTTSFQWPESSRRTVQIGDIQIDGVRKSGGIISFTFPAILDPVSGGPMGPGESVTKTVTYSLTEGPPSTLKSSNLQAVAQTLEVSCREAMKESCYVLKWEHPATIRFVFERTTE